MARTAGSKNKPKFRGGLSIMNFDKQIEGAPVSKSSAFGWVSYGAKNQYPYDLISLYNTSVTHKACIDFAVNAIFGEGIDWDAMKYENGEIPNPNYYTSWNEFIKQLTFDYVLYGAFAFQVIRNKDGLTYSFFHQPVETIRLEEKDEDGVINGAYLCKDWSATGKYQPIRVPLFGFQPDEKIDRNQAYLFYHRKYNPVNDYYGLPVYASAINAIQAEAQYQIWDLKNIVNGFTPTGAITLPQVETDEERQAIIDQVSRMFTGAQNANSLVISFRNNIEDKPIEYTPFVQNSNVNLYEAANERTINRILAGHKIPSKALIGYPADNTGFSDSGAYMEAAYSLYNVNMASSSRNEILDIINTMFKANGVDIVIRLKPLKYRIDETDETINSDDNSNGDTVEETEAVEREDNTI